MQGVLNLFDHMLHDPPGLWPPDSVDGAADRWRYLASLTPLQWLRRYETVYAERGVPIGFDLFKRHIRYLSQFHGRVLHPDTRRYIPVPGSALRRSKTAAFLAGYPSSASFGSSSGMSEDDERVHTERRELLDLLAELRTRCCKEEDRGTGGAEKTFAFSPGEIRRLVDHACTSLEQLVLMVLLTTGMRIGGVARLQFPAGTDPARIRRADDVPSELMTVEKNARCRRILATRCVRCLVARWCQRGRRPTPMENRYVFPSPLRTTEDGRPRETHVSSRHIWRVCRGLFERVGLQGVHVHPHSFRHTVVQMLFMTGSTFEIRGILVLFIRKACAWRGASPSGSVTHRRT